MLTLDDLLFDVLPAGTRVLAGNGSLSGDVSWAVSLRSRPPAFEGIKGGELALVSLRTLRQLDDRLTLGKLIDQLAGAGVAAIAVVGAVDPDSVRAAEQHRMPLLELPEETSTRELEGRITRLVVERRAELQRAGQDLYHQLLELVVAGRGLEAITGRLVEITGRAAVVEDASFVPLAVRAPADFPITQREILQLLGRTRAEDSARLHAIPGNAADPPTIRLRLGTDGLVRIVAPIGSTQSRGGYVSVIGEADSFSATDRLAVSRAAAACAMDLARERVGHVDQESRLTEILDEIVAGSYASEPLIVARAQRAGLDLTNQHQVLSARAVGADGMPSTRPLDRILRRELTRRSLTPAIRTDATGLTAVVPATIGRDGIRALLAAVRAGHTGLGGQLAVVVGRPVCGAREIRDSMLMTARALDLAIRRQGPDAELVLNELGVDELLVGLGPSPWLRAFRDEWLAELQRYDSKHGTELVETLGAYFQAQSSPTEAASRLSLHRNTLLYRLQRIREITGRDPDDPQSGLAFHLALRVDDVLGPTA